MKVIEILKEENFKIVPGKILDVSGNPTSYTVVDDHGSDIRTFRGNDAESAAKQYVQDIKNSSASKPKKSKKPKNTPKENPPVEPQSEIPDKKAKKFFKLAKSIKFGIPSAALLGALNVMRVTDKGKQYIDAWLNNNCSGEGSRELARIEAEFKDTISMAILDLGAVVLFSLAAGFISLVGAPFWLGVLLSGLITSMPIGTNPKGNYDYIENRAMEYAKDAGLIDAISSWLTQYITYKLILEFVSEKDMRSYGCEFNQQEFSKMMEKQIQIEFRAVQQASDKMLRMLKKTMPKNNKIDSMAIS